jgi:hypothetical protein
MITVYGNGVEPEENRIHEVSEEIRKIRKTVMRLALENNVGQVHMVLTHEENIPNLDKDTDFKEFVKNLHEQFRGMKYVALRESHKEGPVHYHVLLNKRIDVKKVQKLWKKGYIFVKQHNSKMIDRFAMVRDSQDEPEVSL